MIFLSKRIGQISERRWGPDDQFRLLLLVKSITFLSSKKATTTTPCNVELLYKVKQKTKTAGPKFNKNK
jgi:hypothetical protein